MAYESSAVNSSGGEGFFPQHPKTGPFESLKGSMLAPHTQMPLESTNTGDPRFNGEVNPYNWEATLKPHEGLTRGGGTMAH